MPSCSRRLYLWRQVSARSFRSSRPLTLLRSTPKKSLSMNWMSFYTLPFIWERLVLIPSPYPSKCTQGITSCTIPTRRLSAVQNSAPIRSAKAR